MNGDYVRMPQQRGGLRFSLETLDVLSAGEAAGETSLALPREAPLTRFVNHTHSAAAHPLKQLVVTKIKNHSGRGVEQPLFRELERELRAAAWTESSEY